MPGLLKRLSTSDIDFDATFARFVAEKREAGSDVVGVVGDIIAKVRADGDAALIAYTEQFDGVKLSPASLRVPNEEIDAAVSKCDENAIKALEFAAKRIEHFHARQKPSDDWFTDDAGVSLGSRWTPIENVGLYVPGGTAVYPSSVLMNALPAKVAGAARIVMVSPIPSGAFNPLVLAAARLAGISEIYRVGGAQSIGALAYGTETIAPVDKIVGPGNAYVAEAKRQVFGIVGIDMIAGPSEILVVADAQNDPSWIAADLLSQAEHDISAQSILITDDAGFADRVEVALRDELAALKRAETAAESLKRFGAIIVVDELAQNAPSLVDQLAPEHLELAVADPTSLAKQIKHAGAIFLGRHTPEAVGDYVAGTNHVLPTGRSARFASGLSVLDFMKRSSLVSCTPDSLSEIGWAAANLADEEGLGAHARSVTIRTNKA